MTDTDQPGAGPGADIDTVTIIVEAFRLKFGDGALRAATLRHDLATEESRQRWAEIVHRLQAP